MKNIFAEKFYPNLKVAKKGEINYSFIDRFTFVHCMIGFGYGCFGFGWALVFLLAIGWEVIENPLKAHIPFIFPHATADTLQNAVGDVLAVLVGWQLGLFILY